VLLVHAIKENVHCNFGAKGLRVEGRRKGQGNSRRKEDGGKYPTQREKWGV
jgi:hypothetical protein